jgi:hypothetical protein
VALGYSDGQRMPLCGIDRQAKMIEPRARSLRNQKLEKNLEYFVVHPKIAKGGRPHRRKSLCTNNLGSRYSFPPLFNVEPTELSSIYGIEAEAPVVSSGLF